MDADTKEIGERWRKAFERKRHQGTSTAEIARMLGLNPEGGIRDWASGKRLPPRRHWVPLARALGESVAYLMAEDDDRPGALEATEALVAALQDRFATLDEMLGMYLDGDPIPVDPAAAQVLSRALGRQPREDHRAPSDQRRSGTE